MEPSAAPPPAYNPAAFTQPPNYGATPYQPATYVVVGAPGQVQPNVVTTAPPPIAMTQQLIITQSWTEVPQRHYCSVCQREVVTVVDYEPGTLTWLAAGGLVIVGCWLGCCLIPFAMNDLKDIVHTCPYCKTMLGKRHRL